MIQTIKPRARQIGPRQWVVYAGGLSVFDRTLSGALGLYFLGVLMTATERHA